MQRSRRIYVLRDPSTLVVRYVGMTRETLDERLARHLDRAFKENAQFHVHHWLRTLAAPPRIEQIDEALEEDAGLVESAWIYFYRCEGVDLTNMTDGGESGWGPKAWTASAALNADPERAAKRNAKISARKKGVPMPLHQRETWSEVMSKATSGKPKSLAWRESVSKAQAGKPRTRGYRLSEETRSRQSKAQMESASAPVSCVVCRRECRGISGISAHLWRAHKLRRDIIHARPWEVAS